LNGFQRPLSKQQPVAKPISARHIKKLLAAAFGAEGWFAGGAGANAKANKRTKHETDRFV
jgi:hypothetical protein